MKKPILCAFLAIILLCQFCFIAGLVVAFDVWPYLKSSAYLLFHGQTVENPDEELVVIQDVFGRFGYMDNNGIVRIWPRFQRADDFSEGLAGAKLGEKYGYIDQTGKFVITPQYELCFSFQNGIAEVLMPERTLDESILINKNGEQVQAANNNLELPPYLQANQQYSPLFPLPEDGNLIMVCSNDSDLYGYIDTTGALRIPLQYTGAHNFFHGVALVRNRSTGYWGMINEAGDPVATYRYSDAESFSEGLAGVQDPSTGLWGFINSTGQIVIPHKYLTPSMDVLRNNNYFVYQFRNGLACVFVSKTKCELIDKTGKVIIPAFDFASPVSKDSDLYQYIKPDEKTDYEMDPNFGYADSDLIWVENPPGTLTFYDTFGNAKYQAIGQLAWEYQDGLCAVSTKQNNHYFDDEVGYIDTAGKQITGFRFSYGGEFKNGVAQVLVEDNNSLFDNYGYIDRNGNYLWLPGSIKEKAIPVMWFSLLAEMLLAFVVITICHTRARRARLIRIAAGRKWQIANPEKFQYLNALHKQDTLLYLIRRSIDIGWKIASVNDMPYLQEYQKQEALVSLIKFGKPKHWRTASPLLIQARMKLLVRNDVSCR